MNIFKYQFEVTDSMTVLMPEGAKILSVQVQRGVPCIWAEVDPTAPIVERNFEIRGTGHNVGQVGSFIATFQLENGSLVFHIFDSVKVAV